MFERLRILMTGRVEWCNPYTGVVEDVDQMSWGERWSVFGIQSYTWKWVRHFGALKCGCTRNPVTRQMVLMRFGCAEHCALDPSDSALLDEEL